MTKPQAETPHKHPAEYEQDLNPDAMKGQNIGADSPADDTVSAYDLKGTHVALPEFTSDELRELRVIMPGRRLERSATYIDLNDRERGEFSGDSHMMTQVGDLIVAKKHTNYELWNRLRGLQGAKRTGTEG
ncbi:hypothetical protein [Chondromyces apiculatus]|uniref:Uncharacterized protein n=1 Tax=Chondromyces apiculatus DSM 436 TaxID=1192034 RepID=A0A017TFI7_9BACT|nr:hypothetical protein [Chondromyces apiculatus]EYF07692.1 Hypothetical protein CAP_8193 [Chondromyces apiculatus DSM 436]